MKSGLLQSDSHLKLDSSIHILYTVKSDYKGLLHNRKVIAMDLYFELTCQLPWEKGYKRYI